MLSHSAVCSPTILILPENIDGEDVIIGDVHGSVIALKKVISSLTPEDRLFIVGDLIDKGLFSSEVVKLVDEHRPDGGKKPFIYVTRGNHEYNFIDYAELKLTGKKTYKADFWCHHPDSGARWVKELQDDALEAIYRVVVKFPYIIHVMGKKPFNIVHADMPFDDNELWRRVKAEKPLTEAEVLHCIDARVRYPHVKMTVRDIQSAITYCGHDYVINDVRKTLREKSNTVNLDVATYTSNCFVAVYHKEGHAVGIGKPSSKRDKKSIKEVIYIINVFLLSNEKRLKYIISDLKDCLNDEVDIAI